MKIEVNKRTRKGSKKALQKAKRNKNDEFYTRFEDIMKELKYYGETGQFKDKNILLPCDTEAEITKGLNDPINLKSMFDYVLKVKKDEWGIKSITTSYWDGTLSDDENLKIGNRKFQDLDFSKYDIIITNPPFSLFREFFDKVINTEGLKFLIIGTLNMSCYKDVFPYIKENKMSFGTNPVKGFINKDKEIKKFGNINWYTNLKLERNEQKILLTKSYFENTEKYQTFDNHPAININKINDIPFDYFEPMGVPITILAKYNPKQFKIVGFKKGIDNKLLKINNKVLFARVIIQRRKENE